MKVLHKLRLLLLVPLMAFSSLSAADYSPHNFFKYLWYSYPVGAVFTQTNNPENNEVLMYSRNSQGKLFLMKSFATGGSGSGDGLGNQGSVVLSKHNRLLFAVNAGSNDISVFAVFKRGLVLLDKVDSGGVRPVSVTQYRNRVYVLNAGSDSIAGFTLNRRGKLTPIADSVRHLSTQGTAPAQIQFSPKGDSLVVTEKATNLIDVFLLDKSGVPGEPVISASSGPTPFGFDFDRRGHLIVSEAAGGAADASSVSSYDVLNNGSLAVISSAIPTTETAACWVVVSPNGRYAYSANTASNSISGYRVFHDGSIELLDSDGVTGNAGEGRGPLDMAMSRNGRFLYAVSPGTQEIVSFKVGRDGSLQTFQAVDGLPGGVNGLAAY